MMRILLIIAALMLFGVVMAQRADIAREAAREVDPQNADRLLKQIEDSGLSKIDNDLGAFLRSIEEESKRAAATTRPLRVVNVTRSDRNDQNEENLYVAGDQTADFQGKVVTIGEGQYPVVAAVYEPGPNRTRVIFPVGSDVSVRRATTMGVHE